MIYINNEIGSSVITTITLPVLKWYDIADPNRDSKEPSTKKCGSLFLSLSLSPARYFCMYVCAAFVEREESRIYPRTRARVPLFSVFPHPTSVPSSAGLSRERVGKLRFRDGINTFRSIRLKDRLTNTGTTDPFVVRLPPPAPQHTPPNVDIL